jgi:acyl-homoserine-lactone acylase
MLIEDASITFDELAAYKLSTRMELADRILDDLARAVEAHGDETARRAMTVLAAWDRTADAGSRGAVLFERFAQEISRGGRRPFAQPWSEARPLETPDGLAEPAAAAAALARAAADVVADHGSLDVPWGEVHRLRLGDRDLPGNGGPGSLGIFRVVGYEADGKGRQRAAGGDSYVAVIEFGTPVRARALLSYGNASQPGSRHLGDQLELFANKKLRPVWRSREEIERHLEEREEVRAGTQ